MEGKTYSLRSGGSNTCPRQAKLEFPCRRSSSRSAVKRRPRPPSMDDRGAKPGTAVDENESPPKRSRVTAERLELVAKALPPSSPTATPTKSPLKETNLIGHVTPTCRSCDPTSKPGTPIVGGVGFKTPPTTDQQRVRKRLLFSPAVSNVTGSGGTLTPLQKTKRSLHNSLPSSLLCRDGQLAELREWVCQRVEQREGGALYVSGAPGTGKTACVTHLLQEMKPSLSGVKVLTVNCMSVTSPQALYTHLATQLQLDTPPGRGKKKEQARERLLRHFKSSKKLIVMVLDEMDQLDCRSQEVLYSLFEWSSLPLSSLILIGIANALDLTDRILPRLTSHTHCKPRLLHFPPYTRSEIAVILRARVGRGEEGEGGGREVEVDSAAIEFCARKVSSVHGDLRKALDICRRAIELVESQQNRCSTNTPSPPHPHNSHQTPTTTTTTTTTPPDNNDITSAATPLRVKLPHIASVISSVYSTTATASLSISTPHSLPLQQKLAVATLLLCVRGKAVKEVTLGRLQDVYGRVCRQWQVRAEGVAEFVGMCQVLESRGLLGIRKAKETRLTKVTLKLQELEVEKVLQDQPLLSSVLKQNIVT